MSDSVRPHRWQPTRLPCSLGSPGKNTGVGCHFLLQCMKAKSESEVAQSYLTLSDPMDCSPPGSSIHGIFQARVLEWGAIRRNQEQSNWGREYLVRLRPPSHTPREAKLFGGSGEAWWRQGEGNNLLSNCSMEMEISPNEIFHYSSSGREHQRIMVLQIPRIFKLKRMMEMSLISLY